MNDMADKQLGELRRTGLTAVVDGYTGRTISVASRYVNARHPTDTEAALSKLPVSSCVLVETLLLSDENEQSFDYTIAAWPGDTTRLALPAVSPEST